MEWELIRFFAKYFWNGALTGLVIRFLIALFSKGDVTAKGAFRSALFGGGIYLILIIIRFYEIS